MRTIEDFYYGNSFPYEKCANLNYEVKEFLKMLNKNDERMTATLSEKQKITFENTRITIVRFQKSVNLSVYQRLSNWCKNSH